MNINLFTGSTVSLWGSQQGLQAHHTTGFHLKLSKKRREKNLQKTL